MLLLLGGVLGLGLVALAWAIGPDSSEAQQGAMHNCPQPGKWAISVWEGDNGTDTGQALAKCGAGVVDFAYYLDPATNNWQSYFLALPAGSSLLTLDSMQGVLAHGAVGAPPAPTGTATPAPSPTPAATPTTQSFSGHDDETISAIQLEEGLTIFTLTNSGSMNFFVELCDSAGEHCHSLVTAGGPFDGSTALGIEDAGTYELNIQASGGWTIKIEQLKPTSAPGVPLTFSGTGYKVSPLFWLENTPATFDMSWDGGGFFYVWLLDSWGSVAYELAYEYGAFDGSEVITVPAGVYILRVQGTGGNWTISVHQ